MKMIKIERDKFWTGFRLMLSSGDGEEHKGCRLVIAALGYYISIALPPIIRPHRVRVFPKWDAATVARLGRNWYWDCTEREYGFYISDGFFNVSFGRQGNDSRTEQRWGCFIPWTQWRFIRHSVYDLDGGHFWTQLERDRRRGDFESHRHAIEECPKAYFAFKDFDGELITAATFIEEREWHKGEGWFKWLSWFYAPMIRRSLSIEFSSETGTRKGSWKGGTMGTGIELLDHDGHRSAFWRYCQDNRMIYVRQLTVDEYLRMAPPRNHVEAPPCGKQVAVAATAQ